ncbi:MAG: transposase [Candidatus Heimdallarchaeota archaeon]|nr:transposase [Candidatus Heimdallarchaeota archaeon]
MSLQTLTPDQPLVIRTYQMGIRFNGSKEERRVLEKEANQRVKGLQVRQDDILQDKNAINAAMGISRLFPDQWRGLTVRAIQQTTKNYSNIADSAYYWLTIASKGAVNREKKILELFQLLQQWNEQAIEWLIFGRSPRVENTLAHRWTAKRIYAINFLTSTRWQLNKFCHSSLKFNSTLPSISQHEIEKSIQIYHRLKHQEYSSKHISKTAKTFLNALDLINTNRTIVAPYLTSWINIPQTSRWKSLKKLSVAIVEVLGMKKRRLFSALRSIIVFALSPYIGKNVSKVIQKTNPEQLSSFPYMKRKKGRIPIILLMNKDHLILRPGNSLQMTELAQKEGKFDLGFILKGFSCINGTLIFSSKVRTYLQRGAKIKVLIVRSSSAPSYKLRVSVVLEGTSSVFMSTRLINSYIKTIKVKKAKALGLDINRLGEHMLAFSSKVNLPDDFNLLIDRYEKLSSVVIPQLSYSLSVKSKIKNPYDFVKTKGELVRVYHKRKKILKAIKDLVPHFIAAVIIKSGCKVLYIENLRSDPRGTRGALAKAIYNMPDEINLFEKAVGLASSLLGYEVKLMKVDPRNTSRFHNGCGGTIQRSTKSYDIAQCKKCGKTVNTHINAARNIKDKGEKNSNSTTSPFPHTRGMDSISTKST